MTRRRYLTQTGDETMAEETPLTPAAGQPQQVQVQVDVSKMAAVYTNFFRLSLSSSTEEILMDVGLHTGIMIPGGMEPIQLTHRLVMNPFVAKRLIESLRQIVSRHEQAFGAMEVDPQKRLRKQG
jgi:hypothetical protein